MKQQRNGLASSPLLHIEYLAESLHKPNTCFLTDLKIKVIRDNEKALQLRLKTIKSIHKASREQVLSLTLPSAPLPQKISLVQIRFPSIIYRPNAQILPASTPAFHAIPVTSPPSSDSQTASHRWLQAPPDPDSVPTPHVSSLQGP
jgi:hypothetical protein